MKLDKFNQLRLKLEVFPFEHNFKTLKSVLYWFSFLGNIFLILFSYFFIKNVTDSIPQLFPGQDIFFSIFVILFMTGYELFKRFALEQLVIEFLKSKKLTINNLLGTIVCLGLIAGSFYLSLNGSHRLIDNSDKIELTTENKQSTALDSIAEPFNKKIVAYQTQLDKVMTKSDTNGTYNRSQKKLITKYEKLIFNLEQERDSKVKVSDSLLQIKLGTKQDKQLAKNQENDLAFIFMTFFLEFMILMGVGFHGYYIIGSYMETKRMFATPFYKKLELNLKLLKLYFHFGKKNKGDEVISKDKFSSFIQYQNVNCTDDEVKEFVDMLENYDIVKTNEEGKTTYNMSYQQAQTLLESQDML